MKDKCDFTLRHYENILKSAKRKGFKFAFFIERNPSQKTIYLRHDIDVFLENAPSQIGGMIRVPPVLK